jgi:hypothetical protein
LQSIALVRVEDEIQIGDRPFLRFHPTLAAAAADDTLAQQPETRRRFIDVYLALRQALDTGASRLAIARRAGDSRPRGGQLPHAVRWAIGDGMIREAAGWGTRLPTICRCPAVCASAMPG